MSGALSSLIVLALANCCVLLVLLASTIEMNVKIQQMNAKLAAFDAVISNSESGR